MILQNPFLSKTFTAIWAKHFAPEEALHSFGFLPSLNFTKNRFLPLFTNVGKTMTKGVGYILESGSPNDYRKKVFLIYDVPSYFGVDTDTHQSDINLYRTHQYPGFLIDLEGLTSLNDYLLTSFSKSSRYKLKKYKKRFEASFDVRYVMYRGEMERETYDFVFKMFRELLEKRFDGKQVTNNNLDTKEWQFYYEVTYPMLLENNASLFVIYNGEIPIGVTLNFFSEDILFDAITVFDIDYAKFHLGSITIMGMLEWCLANNLRIFDFSKGYFDYKTRWCTKAYNFEYHIYHDSKSLRARMLAASIKKFFDLKQLLRKKKLNEKLHRLTYRLKKKEQRPIENKSYTFAVQEEGQPIVESPKIDIQETDNQSVRMMVFEYLYLHGGHYRNVEVYRVPNRKDQLYLVDGTKRFLVTFE